MSRFVTIRGKEQGVAEDVHVHVNVDQIIKVYETSDTDDMVRDEFGGTYPSPDAKFYPTLVVAVVDGLNITVKGEEAIGSLRTALGIA